MSETHERYCLLQDDAGHYSIMADTVNALNLSVVGSNRLLIDTRGPVRDLQRDCISVSRSEDAC